MAESKKLVDDVKGSDSVAEPATSKPVIVGSSNEVEDTVVRNRSTKVIKPLSEQDKESDEEKVVEDKAEEKEETTVPKEENPPIDEDKEEPNKEEQTTEGSAEVDALAGEVDAKRKEEEESRKRDEKIVELEKKIDSKEYYLPIHQSSGGGKFGKFVLVVLLLGAVGAGVAYYYMMISK